MTTPLIGRRSARNLFLSAAVIGGAAFAAAPAQAGVSLDWTVENAYRAGCSGSGLNCTWLGYTTNSPAPMGAAGTATPSDGATGPTVTPQSPRGAGENVTWRFPAASGSISTTPLQGEMAFRGKVAFVSPAPPAGHGFTISVENPRIVLDVGGTTGRLYASGSTSQGTGSYDQSQPVFDLAVTDAGTLSFDGTRTFSLLAPAIATTDLVFPGRSYPAGSGPNRTPNIFGSFTISVTPDTGAKGDKGDTGAAGAPGAAGRNGTNGTNGKDGKDGTTTVVRVQTSSLAKAPFKGKAARKVRVTAKKSTKTLATGTVKGRTITFTIAKGVNKKQLKGTYVLRVVGGKGTATVRIP
ncbi:MAG TPA: HtaA domain-containing protein [Conexibacter sp.]|nr:HtaA domain-containing protein [Conexibacter sp.]